VTYSSDKVVGKVMGWVGATRTRTPTTCMSWKRFQTQFRSVSHSPADPCRGISHKECARRWVWAVHVHRNVI